MKALKTIPSYMIKVDGKIMWSGNKKEAEKTFSKETKKNYDREVELIFLRKVIKTHSPENENRKHKKFMERKEDVPDVYEIVEELEDARYQLEATGDANEVDVRLQVSDGYWKLHIGDASFDTDHSGAWAASMINTSDDEAMLFEVAEDLIDEVLDGIESY